MLIGFCGSQSGMTQFQKDQLEFLLKLKQCSEFFTDDSKGSAEEALAIACKVGVEQFSIRPLDNPNKRAFVFDSARNSRVIRTPTPWTSRVVGGREIKVRWYPVAGYQDSNRAIVDEVQLMIAAPKEHQHSLRSATWGTIRHAWKTKKDIVIIPPIERQEDSTETSEVTS